MKEKLKKGEWEPPPLNPRDFLDPYKDESWRKFRKKKKPTNGKDVLR